MTDGSTDILRLNDTQLRASRWQDLAIVFQGAMNSLNPVFRIGRQIVDGIRAHRPEVSQKEALERSAELLELVGISPDRLRSYPHQLSGGMRQRVMIAMALALDPQVLIMDEPTTALDVVMQRQIVEQIADLRERLGFSVIFITHDVSLLIEIADRIAIMYAGEIVEDAAALDVYQRPRHPYSSALLHSFPPLRGPRRELTGIPGSPPDLSKLRRRMPVPRPLRVRVRRLLEGEPRARVPERARRRPAPLGRVPAPRPGGRARRRRGAAARPCGAVGALSRVAPVGRGGSPALQEIARDTGRNRPEHPESAPISCGASGAVGGRSGSSASGGCSVRVSAR